jgi:hypothetical protein
MSKLAAGPFAIWIKKMINAEDVRSDLSHSRLIKIGTRAFEPLKVTRYSALKVNGKRVDDLSLS